MSKTKVLIIRETIKESVISDGITFCMLVSVMLLSNLWHTQFIGVLAAIMLILGMIVKHKSKPLTIVEARAELDRLEQQEKWHA